MAQNTWKEYQILVNSACQKLHIDYSEMLAVVSTGAQWYAHNRNAGAPASTDTTNTTLY